MILYGQVDHEGNMILQDQAVIDAQLVTAEVTINPGKVCRRLDRFYLGGLEDWDGIASRILGDRLGLCKVPD